jgi:hypothetical protein
MEEPVKKWGGYRGGHPPKNEYPKKKKTWGIEIRLLEKMPKTKIEKFVNDALREKLERLESKIIDAEESE